MEGSRLLLVVNPVAGKIKISTAFFDVVKVFSDAGFDCDVRMTRARGEATELVADKGGEYDLVVLCGGDGTLNEGVTGMLRGGHKTPVGYIPCGTTNDFAAGLGLERDNMRLAAENIVSGKAYPIDVGALGDRYFNYIASFGAFTDTSYSVPQASKNALGHLAYILEGLRALPGIRPVAAEVTLDDGKVIKEEFLFGSVTNATSIGGVVKIDSGMVDFSDGVFEVMLVKNPTTALEISRAILAIQTGRYEDSGVSFYHTKRAVIETESPVPWALDGEYCPGESRMEISVLKHAINIVM